MRAERVAPLVRWLFWPLGFGATLVVAASPSWGSGAWVWLALLWALPLCALALEQCMPFVAQWRPRFRDLKVDLPFLAIQLAVGFATVELIAAARGVALASWPSLPQPWPTHWPLPAQLVLALLVADLFYYGYHRLAHSWEGLWRFHSIHHSSTRLHWLSSTRHHPVDTIGFISSNVLPLSLLGAGYRIFLLYFVIASVQSRIQHSNLDLRIGPLNWLVNSTELHRWHHSSRPEECNANYGNITILWDVLFRTRRLPDGKPAALGVALLPDFPQEFLRQLAAPFRWSRVTR